MKTYKTMTTPAHEAYSQPNLNAGKARISAKTGSSPGDRQRLAYNRPIQAPGMRKTTTLNHSMYNGESQPGPNAQLIPRQKVIA